jgi:hypothetical protein
MLLLPLVLVLEAALATALAAPLTLELVVQGRATAERGGNLAIRGTVQCSVETVVALEGVVVELLGRAGAAVGTFATEVTCGTAPTPWTVIVTSDSDVAFRPGFASAEVFAVGFDPDTGVFTGVQSLVFLHLTRSAH